MTRTKTVVSAVVLAVVLGLATRTSFSKEKNQGHPDAVCYPVKGRGWVLIPSKGKPDTLTIATLTPLLAHDRVIVQSGTISVMDFRTGMTDTLGAGSSLVVPEIEEAKRVSWWEQAKELVVSGMRAPDKQRRGGSVRPWGAQTWPVGGLFAPGVPIVFEWSGIHSLPAFLAIEMGESEIRLPVTPGASQSGSLLWQADAPATRTNATWRLLDRNDQRLSGGSFTVLTAEEAERERQRFRAQASAENGVPNDLEAACLAAAQKVFLW